MRRLRVILALLSLSSCSSDPESHRAASTGTGGQTPDGGSDQGASAPAGAGAGGESAASGGSGGASEICGNSSAGPYEDCDGTDLQGMSCADVGYEEGTLTCGPDCLFVRTACSGTERCTDNKDNDGDDKRDCEDSDCSAACANPCAVITGLASGQTVQGNTQDHTGGTASTCYNDEAPATKQIVYSLTPALDGMLELKLTSDANMTLSLRSACSDVGAETVCLDGASGHSATEFLSQPVVSGLEVFIVVDAEPLQLPGNQTSGVGLFSLEALVRPVVCGDFKVDTGEQCDDGNTELADGCNASCQVDETGTEPNDTLETASALANPYFGAISPEGDIDMVEVTLTNASSTLIAKTVDYGDGGCALDKLDSLLVVLDSEGNVLASDDDGGDGSCAEVVASALEAGIYFIAVSASPEAALSTFGYTLTVNIEEDICGDGNETLGEECDDGNTDPGDGCSSSCALELNELEPNNTPATATVYTAPYHAAISPAGDVDVVEVTVAVPNADLRASTTDGGDGNCWSIADTIVEILDTDGLTVIASDDDSGVGYCSIAEAPNVSPGVYFVRVKPAPLVATETFAYQLEIELK